MVSLLHGFGSLGMGMAIIKYLSDKTVTMEDQIDIVRHISRVLVISILVQTLLVLFFQKEISFYLFASEEYLSLVFILGMSIPILVASRLLETILNSKLEFSKIARNQLWSIISSFFLFILLSIRYGTAGALIGISSYYLFLTVFYGVSVGRHYPQFFHALFSIKRANSKYVYRIFQYGMSNLVRTVIVYFSMVTIRSYVVHQQGVEEIGLFQAAYSISMYIVTGFQAISVYMIPMISKMSKSSKEISAELNNALKNTILMIFPLLAITIIFRKPMLQILYTSEFLDSTSILIVLALAQLFTIMNILNSSILLGMNRLKAFMVIDIGRYLGQVVLFYLFFSSWGTMGLAWAMLLSQMIFYGVSVIWMRSFQLKIFRENKIILGIVMFSLSLVAIISIGSDTLGALLYACLAFSLGIILIKPKNYKQMLEGFVR